MPTLEPVFSTHTVSELQSVFQNAAGYTEPAIERLLMLLKSAGCESFVVEKQYVDLDFKAGYGRFYYLHHRYTDRWCERIHFFSCGIRAEDLYLMAPEKRQAYMGYSVLRPLPTHRGGRSVLSLSMLRAMLKGLYSGEDRYLTCSAIHSVNLAGNKIQFRGTPWMQQDKLIAACASAAIWTTNWHLCHLYPADFRRFTTAQITDNAVRYSMATGRGMPSDGLHVEQMVSALHAMGYEPFLKLPETPLAAKRTVYHYVESGIPVIAIVAFPGKNGLEYHAVTIVGHTLNLRKTTNAPTTVEHRGRQLVQEQTSDYVPRFIAQDDSGGPFRFIEFVDFNELKGITANQKKRGKQNFSSGVQFDAGTTSSEAAFLMALIVPVPKRVTLQGEAAEKNAQSLVRDLFLSKLPSRRIIYRTFLQPSNVLKLWWEPRPTGRPPELGFALRKHNFPNWVWVTEFAEPKLLKEHRTILGQVIQDCSGRGTLAPWDDIIAIISPDSISLFPPDPKEAPIVSEDTLSEPIEQYRLEDGIS